MKKHLLLALSILLGSASTAWAQTDITDQHLQNADFSEGTPIDNHLCGYGKDMAKNGTTYYSMQDVTGWSKVAQAGTDEKGYENSGVAGALFAYNSTWQMKGNGVTPPTQSPTGSAGTALGFFAVWEQGGYYYQDVTLPAGEYTFTAAIYNQSGTQASPSYTGFFPEDSDNGYTVAVNPAVGAWVEQKVTFTLNNETKGQIRVGYKSAGNGSAVNPMIFIDHVSLSFVDLLAAAKQHLQDEIDLAKEADAEGLAEAIAEAENSLTTATTVEALEEALSTLQKADKEAVLIFKNNLKGASAENGIVTDFVVNGTFDSDISGWQRTGTYQNNKLANNQQGDFIGYYWENWNKTAQVNKMYQTISNIPNGTYKLKMAAFVNNLANPNQCQYVFANDDKAYLTTGAPTFYEVWTVVTDNAAEIGLEQTTATANWMGIDNVTLTYYGQGDVKEAAHIAEEAAYTAERRKNWLEALQEAQNALANEHYANVAGEERAALQAEVEKEEPTTIEGYDTAAEVLNTVRDIFEMAKPSYDAFVQAIASNIELPYADASKRPAIFTGTVTTAAQAATVAEELNQALRPYYESNARAEGVAGAVDCTDLITNPDASDGLNGWERNYDNCWSSEYLSESWTDSNGNSEHYCFVTRTNGYNINHNLTISQTIKLPFGRYLLSAKGKKRYNDHKLVLTVDDQEVELPQYGTVFGNGWGDASIVFDNMFGTATIMTTTYFGTHDGYYSEDIICVSDFRLVKIADIDARTVFAKNLEAAETHVLGFDTGEYAPYYNIKAIKTLEEAKSIDLEAEGDDAEAKIVAATQALIGTTWSVNNEDVPIIYDGTLKYAPIQATSENVALPGWTTKSGAIRQTFKGTGENGKACLSLATDNVGVFVWPGTYTYGEQTGYTLPLKPYTPYKFSIKYCSWTTNSNHGVTVSIIKDGKVLVSKTLREEDRSVDEERAFSSWVGVDGGIAYVGDKYFHFMTQEAGNYVLSLSPSGNTFMTDFAIEDHKRTDNSVWDITYNENVTDQYGWAPSGGFENAHLVRSFANGWNAFVVPFNISNQTLREQFGEDVKVAEFTGVEDEHIMFNTMKVPTIETGKPVLIKDVETKSSYLFNMVVADTKNIPTEVTFENDQYTCSFIGTYALKDLTDIYYISNEVLEKSEGIQKMKPGSAYIKQTMKNGASTVALKLKIDNEEIATSINGLSLSPTATTSDRIYNLSGQQVQNPQKGIYIVDGKKMVRK